MVVYKLDGDRTLLGIANNKLCGSYESQPS